VVADAALRAAMSFDGITLADYLELERDPGLPGGFTHVVLVDPPPFAHLEETVSSSREAGGFLHRVWGEPEWRFSLHALDEQLARRPALAAVFRDLRDAGEAGGEPLLEALHGSGSRRRGPEAAARCFRVLAELGLVRGSPNGGDGTVGVVSSEGIDLERSAAFRAYTARCEEGQRYLEGHRQP
jgi:hypothetical protein